MKLHRHSQLNLDTILYTSAGTKARSTFISPTKVTTAKWAHTKLSRHPTERDIPISLMTGWGTLLEHGDEHGMHDPRVIIAYTDSSQLNNATGAGYTIPAGLPHPMKAIVPMGDTVEVFDAELWAIYKCLITCQKHM
jgi:hypothetical protein